jgi:quercetin dioxygenase-like cupin family protein
MIPSTTRWVTSVQPAGDPFLSVEGRQRLQPGRTDGQRVIIEHRLKSRFGRRQQCTQGTFPNTGLADRGVSGYCATALAAWRFDDSHDALYGGDRMNDKPNWRVAHLDEIERRGRDIPVRERLGIHAFGINAFTASEDGALVNEHDEAGSGQEELYIVLDGKVTFEIDGEAVDAQPGTLVFVGPESRRKATGDGTVLVVGATPGEAYEGIDWGDAWQFHSESMTAYREQRYADAVEAVRAALEQMPDHAGLHFNYACFATLAGDTSDDTFAHLRRSVELRPRFREEAPKDDDFAAVRDDPRFAQALR